MIVFLSMKEIELKITQQKFTNVAQWRFCSGVGQLWFLRLNDKDNAKETHFMKIIKTHINGA